MVSLTIVSVVGAFSIIVVGGGLWWGLIKPILNQARLSAQRDVAGAALRGIGNALHIYASMNGGQFPEAGADLATRLKPWIPDSTRLVAPMGTPGRLGGPHWFHYVPGRTTASAEGDVLLYQKVDSSDGSGVQVTYVSGLTMFVSAQNYSRTIDAITLDDGTPWTPHVPGWVPPK